MEECTRGSPPLMHRPSTLDLRNFLSGVWILVFWSCAAAVLVLQVVTHGMLGDPYSEPYILANRIFMWSTGLFLVAMTALSIRGVAAPAMTQAKMVT